MSKAALRILVVLATVMSLLTFALPAQASTNQFRWSSVDKWRFIDHWADWAEGEGYRWPHLYADCLQKSAARIVKSYTASVYNDRWIRTSATMRCITLYGEKWGDYDPYDY